MHRAPGSRRRAFLAALVAVPLLLVPAATPAAAAPPGADSTTADQITADQITADPTGLKRLAGALKSAEPWAAAAKAAAVTAPTAVTEYYVDARRGVLAVGVERLTPALAAAARETFGDAVALHQADRMYRYFSRTDDWPAPHWAGAEIINSRTRGQCTAGFGVNRPGATPIGMLTAGHCGNGLGDAFTNNGQQFGSIMQRERAPGSLDVALLNAPATPTMYTGNRSSTASARVGGIAEVFDGDAVCTSGAATAETCFGRVSGTNLCLTFEDGVETCALDRILSPDSRRLSSRGDSGAPVYVYTTAPGATRPAVNAVGMIVGGNSAGTQVAYHTMDTVLGFFGATLLTR